MLDSRPTFAEINLDALRENYAVVCESVSSRTAVLAVVKADAYGHGYYGVAKELDRLGVDAFGVALLAEGIQLRKAGIDKPILVLGGIYPGQERKCIRFDISSAVFSLDQLKAIDRAAGSLYRKALVHLKVDTGMGRLGVPYDQMQRLLDDMKLLPNICLEGVFSHLATADELDESGQYFTRLQVERFSWAVTQVRQAGFAPRYVHITNSAGTLLNEYPLCNLVRLGIALYGALPSQDFQGRLSLQPVMRFKSAIAMLKWVEPSTTISYGRRFTAEQPALIASVPVGYADGYPRSLTNKGQALVRGQRARVSGTVCMDWLMLDVTHIPNVAVGDDVILMGNDCQGNIISAEELAGWAGTISYELFCGISKRVPRVYIGAGK